MSSPNTLPSEQPAQGLSHPFPGEPLQLDNWVRESFHALDNLQDELLAWHSELDHKQAELDRREEKLEESQQQQHVLREQIGCWKQELGQARGELQQLEEKNSQQLGDLETLERRQVVLETELKVASQRADELRVTLEAERAETAAERQAWRQEFQQMRLLLEHQGQLSSDDVDAPA